VAAVEGREEKLLPIVPEELGRDSCPSLLS
jgi:hypothetical protein